MTSIFMSDIQHTVVLPRWDFYRLQRQVIDCPSVATFYLLLILCLSHPAGGLGGRAAVCSSAHFRTGFFLWIERSCSPRRAHVGPPRVRLARELWPAGGRGSGPSGARPCAAAPRWEGWQ